MPNVFLSYDRDDAEKAWSIAEALGEAGHSVWWDRHIRGGAQFSKEIEEALERADAVVVLWSRHSIESAWVRDEAAVGRDRGCLVPLALDNTLPPLGFRQFQTINLSKWQGRRQIPNLAEIMAAISRQSHDNDDCDQTSPPAEVASGPSRRRWMWPTAGLLAALIITAAILLFRTSAQAQPVVSTAAANDSAASRAMAQALFAKLGTLAEIGSGKWHLVESSVGERRSDLIFLTAESGSASEPRASVTLIDGEDRAVLWSRDFEFPSGRSADLREQVNLTAGRVLDCALEARAKAKLRRDLLKLFLNGCAELADGDHDTTSVITAMGKILSEQPAFTPAWARLLLAETEALDPMVHESSEVGHMLRRHIDEAREIDPTLPEAYLAEANLLPPTAYQRRLALIDRAKAVAPDKAEVSAAEAQALLSVGRMSDAVEAAQRAAKLDPLSSVAAKDLIAILAWAGRTDAARAELGRAERLWAGTAALRDAQWLFHLRFGDPRIAMRMAIEDGDTISPIFIRYRLDPSKQNADSMVAAARKYVARSSGYPLQGLAEAHAVEDAFALISRTSTQVVAGASNFLFRPALADVRRDPRFMQVAKRIGLIDYWRTSGHWPDFCDDTDLPYDCKAEAAKLK